MKKFYLHVSMPNSKFNPIIIADRMVINDDRINFFDEDSSLIASYPARYTVVEQIKKVEL